MPDSDVIRSHRIEFVGVEWFDSIHGDSSQLRQCIKNITLPSVASLRSIFNDVALDVLLFLGTNHRMTILSTVINNMNAVYRYSVSIPLIATSTTCKHVALSLCLVLMASGYLLIYMGSTRFSRFQWSVTASEV